jgi:hypothetical protein
MTPSLKPELVASYLEGLRVEFEAGKRSALLAAVRFCGNQQAVMPEWVVKAFVAATSRWFAFECKTLDDAFGLTWPKGKQFAAAAKKRNLAFAVRQRVIDLHRDGQPINADLFRNVGQQFGIAKTVCEEYYRAADAIMRRPFASIVALDPLLASFVTDDAKRDAATRKVSKLRGSRSKT